jgi:hypothetical protein
MASPGSGCEPHPCAVPPARDLPRRDRISESNGWTWDPFSIAEVKPAKRGSIISLKAIPGAAVPAIRIGTEPIQTQLRPSLLPARRSGSRLCWSCRDRAGEMGKTTGNCYCLRDSTCGAAKGRAQEAQCSRDVCGLLGSVRQFCLNSLGMAGVSIRTVCDFRIPTSAWGSQRCE